MASTSSKRKKLDLSQKVNIIRKLEEGRKQVEVAAEFGLSTSTIQTIWKSREKITENFSVFSPSAAKIRQPKFPKTEEALTRWFDQQRSRNIPVNGPLLKEKAKNFAEALLEPNFAGSDGWLEGWKRRHGISFCTVSGEAGAVEDSVMEKWLVDVWKNLREGYALDDIFNCDETGLFYKLLPNKTMNRKGMVCTGGKLSKERLTLLLCANASGTEKLKPVVIGKYENPRCFANIKKKALPVYYYANSRAWMTQDIFSDWLKKIDFTMRLKKRRIILLVDNCTPHKVSLKLSNIKLVFFPPNLTSKLQPMDQGIINETKKFYRAILVREIIARLDRNEPAGIDVLDAIMKISSAWKMVLPPVIKNCFSHAQLFRDEIIPGDGIEIIESNEPILDDEMLSHAAVDGTVLEEYYHVDDNVLPYGTLQDNEIVSEIQAEDVPHESSEESEGEDDPEVPHEIVSSQQAMECVEKLKMFALQRDEDTEEFFKILFSAETHVAKLRINSMRQPKISEFFQKN